MAAIRSLPKALNLRWILVVVRTRLEPAWLAEANVRPYQSRCCCTESPMGNSCQYETQLHCISANCSDTECCLKYWELLLAKHRILLSSWMETESYSHRSCEVAHELSCHLVGPQVLSFAFRFPSFGPFRQSETKARFSFLRLRVLSCWGGLASHHVLRR